MEEERFEWTASDEKENRRIDVFISDALKDRDISRSRAEKWIGSGLVSVNGAAVTKTSRRLKHGDTVTLLMPETREADITPEDIPIDILYEDPCLAVIVKPAGLVVHPAAGNREHTLVNTLLFHLDSLSGIGGEKRPGIVHRLDKDTSGVMLVAKNDEAHNALSRQLALREIEKHYRAIVQGRMNAESGEISRPIARSKTDRKKMAVDPDGKPALTRWTYLEARGQNSFLDVHILTGRTHQIRVHMQSVGHPVMGDPIYGKGPQNKAPRLMLHAYSIEFSHPQTGERLVFTAPCPF